MICSIEPKAAIMMDLSNDFNLLGLMNNKVSNKICTISITHCLPTLCTVYDISKYN